MRGRGAISQSEVNLAIKETSELLTAECIQNWSETIIVEKCRQTSVQKPSYWTALEEKIHLVMNEHLIVQTDENLNYTMSETRNEHRSSGFASSKQTLKESSVQFELLQENAETTTVKKLLPHASQANLFSVTTFYADNLLLEEGNKCFELHKRLGFVHGIGMKKPCIRSYATLQ